MSITLQQLVESALAVQRAVADRDQLVLDATAEKVLDPAAIAKAAGVPLGKVGESRDGNWRVSGGRPSGA